MRIKSRMKSVSAALFILVVGGCSDPQADSDPADPARQAIERAESRYRDSQAAGHAWQQTKVRLDNATRALQAGDFASARAEAERAEALARASLSQAQAEQTAWRERFPVTQKPSE
jgi:hypothetical protein